MFLDAVLHYCLKQRKTVASYGLYNFIVVYNGQASLVQLYLEVEAFKTVLYVLRT